MRVDGHVDPAPQDDRAPGRRAGPVGLITSSTICPPAICLPLRVEINLAAMAGHAPDRYYSDTAGVKLGMLDARLDLPHTPAA